MMALTEHKTPDLRTGEPPNGSGPVTIVGGGISGMALAAFLAEEGVPVQLFEKQPRLGGVMDSAETGGFLFETGPNTVLDRHDSMTRLLQFAGVETEAHRTNLRREQRYIWHGGRLHEVPMAPQKLLATKLFSRRAKLRLLREPWVPPLPDDEPLEEFIVRRLGREVYDHAFVPMVCGTSGGDPARMSTMATFPNLKQMEREHGSLLKGFIARLRAGRRGQAAADEKRPAHMLTFPGGMRRLAEALEDALARHPLVDLQLGVPVIAAEHDRDVFRLEGLRDGIPEFRHTRRLVLAGDSVAVAACVETIDAELAAHFRRMHYCPMTVVGLGVPGDSLELPPGFGFLAVRGEGVRILGAIFNSNFMPGRAPDGFDTLTVMIGGDLDPAGADLNDQQLLELVRSDLAKVLGWNGEATATHIARWPRAIPQYHMDYHELEAAMQDAERRHPGLEFFGNWRGNPAVGERVEAARKLAAKLAAEVRQEAQAAA